MFTTKVLAVLRMYGIHITEFSTNIPDFAEVTTDLLIECLDLYLKNIGSYGPGV